MRVVVQRVTEAAVKIDGSIKSEIGLGFLVLVGFEAEDTLGDLEWMAGKITQLRIFSDADDKMNLSIQDVAGEILLISQFTLFASTKKGNRPSFIKSARPEVAIPLYENFIKFLSAKIATKTGTFGADMKVSLVNDGPVTITIDSKTKE